MPTTRPGSSGSSGASWIPRGPRLHGRSARLRAADRAAGAVNGLAQTLLKLTAPGVPDTYQGCELWDLSLVDPDNRRPVDYELRRAYLEQGADPAILLANWRDGRIKQRVVARTLALRRRHPDLFETGSYEPLAVTGALGRSRHRFCAAYRAGHDDRGRAASGRGPARAARAALPGAGRLGRHPDRAALRCRRRSARPADRNAGVGAEPARSPSPRSWQSCPSLC